MAPDWNAVLDVLEARIEAHRAVLEGSPAVTPYELPAEIGPGTVISPVAIALATSARVNHRTS